MTKKRRGTIWGTLLRLTYLLILGVMVFFWWNIFYYSYLTVFAKEETKAKVENITHFIKTYRDDETDEIQTLENHKILYSFKDKKGEEYQGYIYDNPISNYLDRKYVKQGDVKEFDYYPSSSFDKKTIKVGNFMDIAYNPSNPLQFYAFDDPELNVYIPLAKFSVIVLVVMFLGFLKSFAMNL